MDNHQYQFKKASEEASLVTEVISDRPTTPPEVKHAKQNGDLAEVTKMATHSSLKSVKILAQEEWTMAKNHLKSVILQLASEERVMHLSLVVEILWI